MSEVFTAIHQFYIWMVQYPFYSVPLITGVLAVELWMWKKGYLFKKHITVTAGTYQHYQPTYGLVNLQSEPVEIAPFQTKKKCVYCGRSTTKEVDDCLHCGAPL